MTGDERVLDAWARVGGPRPDVGGIYQGRVLLSWQRAVRLAEILPPLTRLGVDPERAILEAGTWEDVRLWFPMFPMQSALGVREAPPGKEITMPPLIYMYMRLPVAARETLDRLGGPGGRFPSRRAALETAIQALVIRAAAGQPLPAAPAPAGPERVSYSVALRPDVHARLMGLVREGQYPSLMAAVVAALTLLNAAPEEEGPAADSRN